MFQRSRIQVLTKRLKEKRRFIQAIVGLRQVGKTTLAGQLLKVLDVPFHFVSADAIDATNKALIQQQWETVRIQKRVST